MSTFRPFIEEAVRLKGSQQKLAEAIGCSQQQISYLLQRADRISGEMAIAVERATAGAISRHDLRPDMFGSAPRRAVSTSSPEAA